MKHQPESESGTAFVPALGVYAGWLAHRHSFASGQSAMADGAGNRLLFAGETFSPAPFAGPGPAPDTQTTSLLGRYRADGDDFVAALNGLFSGLLIDVQRRRAILFNDRYGSERIYVAEKDGSTFFASEAKALLLVLPELRAFDEAGLAQFLTFGSMLDGNTLFRGVRLLPGGSLWTCVPGSPIARTRYFTPQEWERQPLLDDAAFEAQFAETFKTVLTPYLACRGPLGLSLTGGLDTRMIVACMPRTTPPPVAYTYAAQVGDTLDVKIAARVAASRGMAHAPLRIGSEFLADFGRHVDRTVHVTDGCAGALGAHEIYFSEQARRLAAVRLTGNFGSEVLRSMSTFKPLGLPAAMFDAGFAARLGSALADRRAHTTHPVTHAAFEEVPWHLFGTLAAGRSQLTFRTPYLDNRIVKLAYQAPPHLRRTPEPALRLIHANDAALASIPTDRGLSHGGSRLLGRIRRLFCDATFKLDYWHKEGLPDELSALDPLLGSLSGTGVLGLHKFLPYRGWFRRELSSYAAQVVGDGQTRRMPFWNPRFLDAVVAEHATGRRNRLREIHTILTLEAVQRTLLSADSHTVDSHSAHSHTAVAELPA